MAESSQHQILVTRIVNAVLTVLGDYDGTLCYVDGASNLDGMPRKIERFRPDVYAVGKSITIVGEAKPPWDVESLRTERQLRTFLRYVEADKSRHFVLAVHWTTAVTAKSLVKNLVTSWSAVRERVHILDGVQSIIIRR